MVGEGTVGCFGITCGEVVGQVIRKCQVSPYPKTRPQRPHWVQREAYLEVLMWDDILTETEHGGTRL